MTVDIVGRALEVHRKIQQATGGRTMDGAVREFVHTLTLIPDCAPSEISSDQIEVLRGLAESVIEQIEARLAQGSRPQVEQDLAAGVYAIRRALEEIDRWQRHYAVG
jgi:hypothetical protein